MYKTTIITLIDNIGSPAFIVDEYGNILHQNKYMRYISERLKNEELTHISEMNIILDEEEAIKSKNSVFIEQEDEILDIGAIFDYSQPNQVHNFYIEGTTLDGLMYDIVTQEKEPLRLFVFDKTIALDRMIGKVMEHIDEVIVTFNEHGTLEKMNSLADQILPFKGEDVIGKNIQDLVDEGLVIEDPIILKMINKKETIYQDIVYPNGKIISYTAVPIFGSTGSFRGGVLTGRDISRIINLVRTINTEADDSDIEYISENKEVAEIKAMINRVAPSDASIFIMGESGVGKEILTRTIWKQSARRDDPFIAINCAAIPSELIESELFGYEKGAFTGASEKGKEGLIVAADGGTLFLDEIGEMPLETQKKLLRVIQEKSVTPIGSIKPIKVDVRFISATNKTAEDIKNPAIFRQDLYYRLSVVPIVVPPLRDRKEDILPIANFYIARYNDKYGRNINLTTEAEDVLLGHNWPGNIRELKNVIERLVVVSPHELIYANQMRRVLGLGAMSQIEEVPLALARTEISGNGNSEDSLVVIKEIMNIDEAHKLVEQEILKKAILKYGNVTKAAKAVGINPATVYRKIKSGYINLD